MPPDAILEQAGKLSEQANDLRTDAPDFTNDGAKSRILLKAQEAFLAHGYARLTMGKLAEVCGISRRGLYYNFKDKEEVLRASVRYFNALAIELAEDTARKGMARGDNAIDVIAKWLDIRFGDTRRRVGNSRHGRELNDVVFRVAHDIIIEVSRETNAKLAQLIEELIQGGRMTLREGVSIDKTARLVGDGARGVNQARPPVPNELIAQAYYDVAEAILFGCAVL